MYNEHMMKVHLIASRSNVSENFDNLQRISEIISEEKHQVARDWVSSAHSRLTNTEKSQTDWSKIYQLNLETIAKADVIIAEITHNSFGVGYQIAVAVQQKKPVLLLRRNDATTDVFATGIVDPWVKSVLYTEDTLDDAVRDFLKENDIGTKDMRFNFFIDRKIYNYLRWSSFKTGRTKAEVLRELVEREIEKQE
jgi:nucleoside 2-deoxyribosyltransferase